MKETSSLEKCSVVAICNAVLTNASFSSFYALYSFYLMTTFSIETCSRLYKTYCLCNEKIVRLTELFFGVF